MDIIATSESTWQESAGSVVVADYNDGLNDGIEEGKAQANAFFNQITKGGTFMRGFWANARYLYPYTDDPRGGGYGKALPVPMPDTSKAEDMSYFFAKADPYQIPDVIDLSRAKTTAFMFAEVGPSVSHYFSSLDRDMSHIVLDMSSVEDANNMFAQCLCSAIPTLVNMQNVTTIKRLCYHATRAKGEVYLPDTSACKDFSSAFEYTSISKLTLNVSSGENFSSAFGGNITDFTPIGTFKASVSFKACTNMIVESWERIFNALADLTGQTACTLTIPTGLDETIIPSELRALAKSRNWNVMEA